MCAHRANAACACLPCRSVRGERTRLHAVPICDSGCLSSVGEAVLSASAAQPSMAPRAAGGQSRAVGSPSPLARPSLVPRLAGVAHHTVKQTARATPLLLPAGRRGAEATCSARRDQTRDCALPKVLRARRRLGQHLEIILVECSRTGVLLSHPVLGGNYITDFADEHFLILFATFGSVVVLYGQCITRRARLWKTLTQRLLPLPLQVYS